LRRWRQWLDVGILAGWAILIKYGPGSVRFVANRKIVSEVKELVPRPDVVDGFKKQKLKIKSASLGFAINIPTGIQRTDVAIELVSNTRKVVRVPLDSVECGRSFQIADGVYLGLDSERWCS
jgi:hypothetical protein